MTTHGFDTPASWLIRADPDGLLPVARSTDRRLHKLVDLVLRPILELEKRGELISAAIGDAARDLGLAKSNTWSLYRRLRENDARATALELDRRVPKPGSKRIGECGGIIIDESPRRCYLVRERSSLLRIWSEIRAECEAKGFQPPTRRTVKARLDAMDQREVYRKRRGAQEADKVFSARPGRLEVSAPLEVVQIDHTPTDIMLVDQVNRRPLARPYLTVAIDVATRIVLGLFVTFDEPSVLSIALCHDHCVRRKSIHVPGTVEELVWSTAGIRARAAGSSSGHLRTRNGRKSPSASDARRCNLAALK